MGIVLQTLIIIFLAFNFCQLRAAGFQKKSDEVKQQETVKYFRTELTRMEILGDEIGEKEAKKINHFKAIYSSTGKLMTIKFIPSGEKSRKRMKKQEIFPKPSEPFRFFESWNPHTHILNKELDEGKLGDRPFYRASYEDSTHVKTVEYFRKINKLLWTYYIQWNRDKSESTLSIVFSSHRPLTALDPHLFHPSLSEMKPGWIAEFKHNRLAKPLSVKVRDAVGNTYYFYKFRYRFETVGDTINPTNYRITTSEYFKADSSLIGSHTLTFTENNRLWKKDYFDAFGKLSETIEYDFNPELNEVTVIIRDPKGNILYRQVRPQSSK